MTYAAAEMNRARTADRDASFAASMAAILLFVLGIAAAMSIFVVLLAKLHLLVLAVLGLIILSLVLVHLSGFAVFRRKNRQR